MESVRTIKRYASAIELKYLCALIASATVNFTANMKTPSFITNRIKNK